MGKLPITVKILLAFYTLPCFASDFNLTEIAAGLYIHQGKQLSIRHNQRDDIANIGFIIGKKCIAVIDSGGSIAAGGQLRASIKKRSSLPICYVINTHVHFDHVLGNHAFKIDQPKFVGHRELLDAIEANRSFFLNHFEKELSPIPAGSKIIGPDLLVDDQLTIDLGDRELVLTAQKTAHTNHDLTVFDKNTNSLWLGDLLSVRRLPALDGSLKGWVNVIRELLASKYEKVIPGHGPIPKNWRLAASAQLRYFTLIADEIRDHIKKGDTLETAVETVGKSERKNWLLFDEAHKRNVTRAFAELEWE